jgi:hypothetical protein
MKKRKKPQPATPASAPPTPPAPKEPELVVPGWGPPWLRLVLAGVAGLYMGLLAIGNSDYSVTDDLPGAPRFFLQVACLFPDATEFRIEYRAEGWRCDQRRFVELDHRPYFPIRAEDKESRFHRLGQFYRRSLPVMRALERYLIEQHSTKDPTGELDGVPGPMGGIRLWSLRIPLPKVGEQIAPYQHEPLSAYSEQMRREWYETSIEERKRRCGRE